MVLLRLWYAIMALIAQHSEPEARVYTARLNDNYSQKEEENREIIILLRKKEATRVHY